MSAPLKTVSLCGVNFEVIGDRLVCTHIDRHGNWDTLGSATIPCAKGRLKALLAVLDYSLVDEEKVS